MWTYSDILSNYEESFVSNFWIVSLQWRYLKCSLKEAMFNISLERQKFYASQNINNVPQDLDVSLFFF